ncbi:probable sucrose-phosphate synthase 2 [Brassica napus]|uniref:Sucrose-phosphate synthase n=1 Tax=Brassica oleracea var. oleracea TaxID=109376 RepID=A0A0D3B0K9_BRAOL|nr:PREDICTED: probable sucrose-phosphate synthase 2 [Brassica oleracea var. oleracea]XP_013661882.2 probable sucrose-phosphate synthase 2 [Brassica napus]
MVGNDWVNSYLEAILAAEPGIGDSKSSLLLRERGHFSPSRYFVEEVITGFDETDLHRSWVQAAATRSPQERNTRLENLCWRIWNLARQKKKVEGKNAKRAAKRHLLREKARKEVTADMSEDFSEGEKADVPGEIPTHSDGNTKGRMSRISSVDVFENWFAQHKEKKLYIVLISLHGLIRGENMELGRDSDTGGQVKYVVELARALGSMPGVYRVDLLTRQVSAPDVDSSYSEPTEMLNPLDTDSTEQEHGESSGAYIVRIPFGPKDKYVPKELLWPHIPEFVDRALSYIMKISKALDEEIGEGGGGGQVWPVSIHGHYADAGDSAALLSGALNVPMVFTGHSLGRDKLEQLLKQGRPKEEINANYKIMRRIEAEELCLDASEIVITSTKQEIEEQWRLYDGFDPVLERKLRARMKRGVSCLGRFMPRMVVIPPGMEFHHIVPHDVDADGDDEDPQSPDPPIWSEIMRFFSNPRKPMILALARPDPKKNLVTLVKAFGECRPLRELANLTLIMGNRNDIDELSTTNASVLLSILKLIDKYDLYGQVAMPKHHKQSDVPEIYRLAAKTKGVFINPAFIEPFGLTLIEAGAHGLPTVATINGGPVDIQKVLDNGLLVDPHDQQAISDALLKLVSDKHLWTRCRQNGLKNIHLFSWPEHCKTYLARIASCKQRSPKWQRVEFQNSDSDSPSDSLRDIHDISLNLKLSLDGEKSSVDTNLDAEDTTTAERKAKLEKAVSTLSQKKISTEKIDSKMPTLKRRKHIFVISVDCSANSDLLSVVKTVMDVAGDSTGFILSTSMTVSETHTTLLSGGLKPQDFDAVICNSGSELYFTASASSEDKTALPYTHDPDYHSHIEFRWGGENLRKTLIRWISSVEAKKKLKQGEILCEDEASSTNYCLSFKVKDPASIPPMKELRKLMRIQALRCNVVYCQNGARLNVIPVLASRSQALRYLLVRWGIDLSNMVVFVGDSGDTDYEGLLGGVHKTVILKGIASDLRELHGNRSYPMEDVTPLNSPNITEADECGRDAIKAALGKLGINLLKP